MTQVGQQPNEKLKNARLARGWSQQEVADHTGSSANTVSRWELGQTVPGQWNRQKLSALFGLSLSDLGFSAPISEEELPPDLLDPLIPLPAPVPLVGRDALLSSVSHHIFTEYITALYGMPGVGKTALAVAIVHAPETYKQVDGILWASLGPHVNRGAILTHWEALLHVPTHTDLPEKTRLLTLRTVIGARRLLIILDDAWRYEDVLGLLLGGNHCYYLVTSRFLSLAIQMDLDPTMVAELSEEDGLTLLRMLAPDVVQQEVQQAAHLVSVVGGLPLALLLMGNYLRLQASSHSSRRVHLALERLTRAEERFRLSELQHPTQPHPSLAAETTISLSSCFAVTEQLMNEQEREAFSALALFPPKPNSFSEAAALSVAACPGEILDALADLGLVQGDLDGRYLLHPTLRDYARLHFLHHQVYERFVHYFAAYVKDAQGDTALLALEATNIEAARQVARQHNIDSTLLYTEI